MCVRMCLQFLGMYGEGYSEKALASWDGIERWQVWVTPVGVGRAGGYAGKAGPGERRRGREGIMRKRETRKDPAREGGAHTHRGRGDPKQSIHPIHILRAPGPGWMDG